ncbi:MAG: DNA replication/repair protein RecF [Bacteroidia bacterium]
MLYSLSLTQFRSWTSLELDFGEGFNVLTGLNGTGKTNVLDAIHFLAFTKGLRSSNDKQAVEEGSDFFMIKGEADIEGKKREVQCNFFKGKGKRVLVNGKEVEKMSEHIGRMPLVASLPTDTILINDAAAERRRFLDMLIAQYSADYLQHLILYNRILAQRNALLRQFQEQRNFDPELLSVWDQQLIPHGQAVYKARAMFVREFAPIFSSFFHKIVSEKEEPIISYRSQVKDNSEQGWMDLLTDFYAKDRANLYTGCGIHRDDLSFKINDVSARHFGSQGQQKTFVIALRLAQYQLLLQHTSQPPILLLDDLFEKLDNERLAELAAVLDEDIPGQVFITDTSRARLEGLLRNSRNKELRFFEVEKGEVVAGG